MRPAEQGFTLIEVLVALTVFSLAAMALLNVAGENTRTASVVTTRVMAGVVAENQAVALTTDATLLAAGDVEGSESQGGRLWRWSRKVSSTDVAGIMRLDVTVTPDGSRQPAAELSLFRSVR